MTRRLAGADALAELRGEFDGGFAMAPAGPAPAADELLLVRIGGTSYAIRAREVTGIASSTEIVPLPSRAAHLLGIASVRGRLVAVYDLGPFLGHARAGREGRCILLHGTGEPVGYAVDELESFVRAQRADIRQMRAPGEYLREAARLADSIRPIVDLASVTRTLETAEKEER